MHFLVEASSQSGIQSAWSAEIPELHRDLKLAIPPEFDGPGNGFSPEDLYALALQNCFIATFKVFAEKSKLVYSEIATRGQLTVDRNEKGQPWMAQFHLVVSLKGVQQKESAQRILEKVTQSCMILNSVNTQKSFEFKID